MEQGELLEIEVFLFLSKWPNNVIIMYKILSALLLAVLPIFELCERETVLTVDQPVLSFTEAGGSQIVSITANKFWTARSDESWCEVSPNIGDGDENLRLTITCEPNSSYDERSCTVTLSCDEVTKTISVSQGFVNGLMISQTTYELTKAAQQLNIEIKANVKYIVEVDNGCKDWVKFISTKGMTTSTAVLDIDENKTYDSREGKVTIKQDGGSLSSTIIIKQSQQDGLFLTSSEFDLSCESQLLTIELSTNVEFDVTPEADWVKCVQTKGLINHQIILEVLENETFEPRETIVNVQQKNGNLKGIIRITQDANGFVEFEDENFKAYCVANFDLNDDGKISYSEALVPENMYCPYMDISSMSGIERFTNVVILYCEFNQLTTLNISSLSNLQYLFCHNNKLTKLDVSSNYSLGLLECGDNRLSSLEFGDIQYLQRLSCNNNHLTTINLDRFSKLYYLNCCNNPLKSLSVGNNNALKELYCASNQLVSLDVSNNPALEILNCSSNMLNIVDVRNNLNLISLVCDSNTIASLDLTYNPLLTNLSCSINQMSSLNLCETAPLTSIICNNNKLTSVNVAAYSSLTHLDCANNQLTALNVTNNSALRNLTCANNNLSLLDVSNNMCLQNLSAENNNANIIIYIKGGQVFNSIICDDTASIVETEARIPSGNINFDDAAFKAYCVSNFDVNGDGEISYAEALIVTEMRCGGLSISSLLGIEFFKNIRQLNCSNNQLSILDLSNNTLLTDLSCGDNQLVSLVLNNNGELKRVSCYNNKLASINIPNNTKLLTLLCGNNELRTMNVKAFTELNQFECNNNKLEGTLDLSNNPSISILNCENNSLTGLIIGNNPKLGDLRCSNNQLSEIDLSGCNTDWLWRIDCLNNASGLVIWFKTGQTPWAIINRDEGSQIKYKE